MSTSTTGAGMDIDGVLTWADVFRLMLLMAALILSFRMGRAVERERSDDERR